MATATRLPRQVVRRRAKAAIDPGFGARVRDLRIARGLTQAALAGDDFTKGFISLVETGRTRVSLRAAEILASRLGVSAPELLAAGQQRTQELELLLLRGEQQLAAGQPAAALEFVERVATDATGMLRARALRGRGRALRDAGRPRDALPVLEEASRAFEALGQRELQVRTLFDRAQTHAHLDEPGNALALALECEAAMRVGGLVDRTLELQLRSFLAVTFARTGDFRSADGQARQALTLADDVVDREALGTLYSTLALTRERQRAFDEALRYARKGLAAFEDLGRDRAIGQMWHNVALIQLRRGAFAESERAIERADAIARSAKIGTLAARLLELRAELAVTRRQWARAGEYADAALAHGQASAVTRGRALLVRARVLAATRASAKQVRDAIAAATEALKGEPPSARAEAAETLATLLAQRGEWKAAFEEASRAITLLRPQLQ